MEIFRISKILCRQTGIFNRCVKLYTGIYYAAVWKNELVIADVGAGTGKLTENLVNLQCPVHGFAVEPNDAMREEGVKLFGNSTKIIWKEGSAESTGLEDSSVDWVLMGSSFHWTDAPKAMKEFYRILKPGGFLLQFGTQEILRVVSFIWR